MVIGKPSPNAFELLNFHIEFKLKIDRINTSRGEISYILICTAYMHHVIIICNICDSRGDNRDSANAGTFPGS